MPPELAEYSDCPDLIHKAQLAARRRLPAAPAVRHGAGGAAAVAPPTPTEQHTLESIPHASAPPVQVGGEVIHPGVVHVNLASAFNTLPTPLLALLAFLLACALLRSRGRAQARPQPCAQAGGDRRLRNVQRARRRPRRQSTVDAARGGRPRPRRSQPRLAPGARPCCRGPRSIRPPDAAGRRRPLPDHLPRRRRAQPQHPDPCRDRPDARLRRRDRRGDPARAGRPAASTERGRQACCSRSPRSRRCR